MCVFSVFFYVRQAIARSTHTSTHKRKTHTQFVCGSRERHAAEEDFVLQRSIHIYVYIYLFLRKKGNREVHTHIHAHTNCVCDLNLCVDLAIAFREIHAQIACVFYVCVWISRLPRNTSTIMCEEQCAYVCVCVCVYG